MMVNENTWKAMEWIWKHDVPMLKKAQFEWEILNPDKVNIKPYWLLRMEEERG